MALVNVNLQRSSWHVIITQRTRKERRKEGRKGGRADQKRITSEKSPEGGGSHRAKIAKKSGSHD